MIRFAFTSTTLEAWLQNIVEEVAGNGILLFDFGSPVSIAGRLSSVSLAWKPPVQAGVFRLGVTLDVELLPGLIDPYHGADVVKISAVLAYDATKWLFFVESVDLDNSFVSVRLGGKDQIITFADFCGAATLGALLQANTAKTPEQRFLAGILWQLLATVSGAASEIGAADLATVIAAMQAAYDSVSNNTPGATAPDPQAWAAFNKLHEIGIALSAWGGVLTALLGGDSTTIASSLTKCLNKSYKASERIGALVSMATNLPNVMADFVCDGVRTALGQPAFNLAKTAHLGFTVSQTKLWSNPDPKWVEAIAYDVATTLEYVAPKDTPAWLVLEAAQCAKNGNAAGSTTSFDLPVAAAKGLSIVVPLDVLSQTLTVGIGRAAITKAKGNIVGDIPRLRFGKVSCSSDQGDLRFVVPICYEMKGALFNSPDEEGLAYYGNDEGKVFATAIVRVKISVSGGLLTAQPFIESVTMGTGVNYGVGAGWWADLNDLDGQVIIENGKVAKALDDWKNEQAGDLWKTPAAFGKQSIQEAIDLVNGLNPKLSAMSNPVVVDLSEIVVAIIPLSAKRNLLTKVTLLECTATSAAVKVRVEAEFQSWVPGGPPTPVKSDGPTLNLEQTSATVKVSNLIPKPKGLTWVEVGIWASRVRIPTPRTSWFGVADYVYTATGKGLYGVAAEDVVLKYDPGQGELSGVFQPGFLALVIIAACNVKAEELAASYSFGQPATDFLDWFSSLFPGKAGGATWVPSAVSAGVQWNLDDQKSGLPARLPFVGIMLTNQLNQCLPNGLGIAAAAKTFYISVKDLTDLMILANSMKSLFSTSVNFEIAGGVLTVSYGQSNIPDLLPIIQVNWPWLPELVVPEFGLEHLVGAVELAK